MKINRYKKAQRILGFYQNHFGFKEPYTILLDGPFCRAALEAKVLIKDQLPKYLGGQTKLVTTQCVILEAEKLSKIISNLYGTWMIVKQFAVHTCGHEGNPRPASTCIRTMLRHKNPAKYIVATQDDELRDYIHQKVTGTPVLYLHTSAPTLEKPSEKTNKAAKEGTTTMSTYEASTLQDLKRKHLGEVEQEPPVKKKKKSKNPNPLSCLKSKKVKKSAPQVKEDGKKKRKRHKKKQNVIQPPCQTA
ncbi:hypothetical protein Pmani_001634 [Petrolisthes manimaculis]|uniref:rRNA-processing protein UTP23 homolog n=1 Tax=Petrolisthes manimaculis TaxID=1843537 RepID=A0AAE1UP91_9EUCA|nr:hypothetical protein Pmani_001634 [Petrolisthes manimaculis]